MIRAQQQVLNLEYLGQESVDYYNEVIKIETEKM